MNSILDNELVRERFFKKVEKTDSCWNWIACVGPKGYGRFGIGKITLNAHVASWLINKGEIGDKWVLHTCDNKRCVRIGHLYLGTAKDNSRDAVNRGQLKGRRHPSKLTWKMVREIRAQYNPKQWSYSSLGRKFGVSKSSIDGILNRRKWRNDPNDLRLSEV